MIRDKNRRLINDENIAWQDKKTFYDWIKFKITLSEACQRINQNNNIELTEDEFIEYAEFLGWRLGE